MTESKAYGNIEIFSPGGQLMFIANESKLRSYKKNNLVEEIGENQYKLLFEPKGLGYAERNSVLLSKRENKCICCGDEELANLTRHHIVPSRYRKYLPEYIKSNDYRYVVFLCRDCHDEYNFSEEAEDERIAVELGIKSAKACDDDNYNHKKRIVSLANVILYKEDIPEDRMKMLRSKFTSITGMQATHDNLLLTLKNRYEPSKKENIFGAMVIDKIPNIYEFQKRWLLHFIEHMKPKYLPNDLKILVE